MKHLTCAETAKLVRKALKECFPGQKFSVRSSNYSMGASIRVEWTDGPNAEQVNAVVKRFEGATFDGMTDYKGGKVSELNGESVHFGADFVRTKRNYSEFAAREALQRAKSARPDLKWDSATLEPCAGSWYLNTRDINTSSKWNETRARMSYMDPACEPSVQTKTIRTY